MGKRSGILVLLLVMMMSFSCDNAIAQCDSAINLTMKAIKSAPKVTIEGDWDLVNNALHYEVVFSNSDVPPASGNTTSINKAFGLNQQPDVKTCMHVRTICNSDTSSWSTKCIIAPCTSLQPLPVNIAVGFAIPGTATAYWPDAGNASIKYEYALSDDSTLPGSLNSVSTNQAAFSGLITDSTYCLHIRYYCSNSQTYSPWTIRCFKMTKMSTAIRGTLSEDVSIYPNPAKDILNINLPDIHSAHNIVITDIAGRVIHSTQADKSTTQLNTSILTNGIYLIRIAGKEYNTTQKLLIAE